MSYIFTYKESDLSTREDIERLRETLAGLQGDAYQATQNTYDSLHGLAGETSDIINRWSVTYLVKKNSESAEGTTDVNTTRPPTYHAALLLDIYRECLGRIQSITDVAGGVVLYPLRAHIDEALIQEIDTHRLESLVVSTQELVKYADVFGLQDYERIEFKQMAVLDDEKKLAAIEKKLCARIGSLVRAENVDEVFRWSDVLHRLLDALRSARGEDAVKMEISLDECRECNDDEKSLNYDFFLLHATVAKIFRLRADMRFLENEYYTKQQQLLLQQQRHPRQESVLAPEMRVLQTQIALVNREIADWFREMQRWYAWKYAPTQARCTSHIKLCEDSFFMHWQLADYERLAQLGYYFPTTHTPQQPQDTESAQVQYDNLHRAAKAVAKRINRKMLAEHYVPRYYRAYTQLLDRIRGINDARITIYPVQATIDPSELHKMHEYMQVKLEIKDMESPELESLLCSYSLSDFQSMEYARLPSKQLSEIQIHMEQRLRKVPENEKEQAVWLDVVDQLQNTRFTHSTERTWQEDENVRGM